MPSFGASFGGLSVMCCGCGGFLGKDATVVRAHGLSDKERSFMFRGRVIHNPSSELVAEFLTAEEAEDAAKESGWESNKDATGEPDHRCPQCASTRRKEREKVGHHPGKEAGAKRGLLVPTFL